LAQTASPGTAQSPAPTPARTSTPETKSTGGDLNSVLEQMDEASTHFKAAQADVELVQYTAVVKEKDVQSGHIFFRRKGRDTEVALWIEKPHPKQAVVRDDKVTFYDPRTKQVTERTLGDNKQDVEAVMNLGFGGGGRDLLREYDVTMAGWEDVDRVRTAKLELVAKSERLRRLFSKLVLWIDPARDVALQQQRFEASGDYQLSHYTNIKLSSNISDDKFTIKK
jgi:outer membrane lipoprotein-sorting protein